ncbi:MAG: Fur family transcriptional regulator [Terriglobales bacterium]
MSHSFDRKSLLETLSQRGVRLTTQRRTLIGIIQAAEQHLDAAQLLRQARVSDPSMDRATVYRTLELLKKHGLIDELDLMHLQGEKHYYEVRTRREHMHLACFRCQDIVEFASPLYEKLKQEMARQTGFELQVMRLEAGGLCPDCRAAAR